MVIEDVKAQLDKYIAMMTSQGKMKNTIIISEEQYFVLSGHGERDVRDYRGYTLIIRNLKKRNGHGK